MIDDIIKSCGISINSPIFNVYYNKTYYYFIGHTKNLNDIYRKIQNKKILTTKDKLKINKSNYKNELLKCSRQSNSCNIEFIQCSLYLDDSIDIIRKKIFVNLSNLSKKKLIIPENQELYIETKTGYEILGYKYTEDQKPIKFIKKLIDKKFVDSHGNKKDEYKLINNNKQLLYNFIKNMKENTIYLTDLNDVIEKLRRQKIKITEIVKNSYILKYFPRGKINYDLNDEIEKYKRIKNNIEKTDSIINFINNINTSNDLIKDCNVIQCLFHINSKNENKFINLDKLFLKIKLSNDVPFIKYKNPLWKIPKNRIIKNITKLVDKETLTQWMVNIKILKGKTKQLFSSSRGLTIKYLITNKNNENKYATLNINKNGYIEIKMSFTNNDNASVTDIVNSIIKISDFIKNKINKIDYQVKNSKEKIQIPVINIKNNIITTSDNTKLVSLSSSLNYNLNVPFQNKKVIELAEILFPYLTENKTIKTKNINFKYIRVNNYKSINIIFNYISNLKEHDLTNNQIIEKIKKNFNKTNKEATEIMNNYENRFSYLLKLKYNEKFQDGINLNISNTKTIYTGIKDFVELINVTSFTKKFLQIYNNLNDYLKNSEFKKIINIEQNNNNNNNMNLLNSNSNININSNFANDYFNNTNNNNNNSKIEEYKLADESQLEPKVRLSCKESKMLKSIDTCEDLCEDKMYKLRRLQEYDNPLFKFPKQVSKINYSRRCAETDGRQPIVMHSNPEDNPKIDRDSYTYAIKYGSDPNRQNYYLCPKVWCPYCQIPLNRKKIKNVRERKSKKGKCLIGKCPHGDHNVIIYKGTTMNKAGNKGLYPGLLPRNKHPKGYCLPCCFLSDPMKSSKKSTQLDCLGIENNNNNNNNNNSDKKLYIKSKTKIPLINNKYGHLSYELSKLFSTNQEVSFIEKNNKLFLRKEITQNKNQSFLSCMNEYFNSRGKKYNLIKFKKHIISKLTDKLFSSLNNGLIKIMFGNINNYKNLLLSDKKIDYNLLWDLCSRPGIVTINGINIFITENTKILCPVGENVKNFYSPNKNSIFINKYTIFFEPIVYIKNINNQIIIKYIFNSINDYVIKFFEVILINCIEKTNIDWKRILKDNEKILKINYLIPNKNEQTLYFTLQELNKLQKTYSFKGQIVDTYNKVNAILLQNNTYLPIKPQGIKTELNVIEKIKLLDYKKTLKQLKFIYTNTNINCKPIQKIISNNKIIAIIIETGRIIPIKESKMVNDNLEISETLYYSNVDNMIKNGKVSEFSKNISDNDYEEESFQLVRYELSKYLNENPKIKNKINDLINSSLNLNIKRNKLNFIIKHYITKLTTTNPKQINNYVKPKFRERCSKHKSKNTCDINPHCLFVNNNCKIHINNKNLITNKNNINIYSIIITEELLRYIYKRNEIMSNKMSNILNSNSFNNNEIMLSDSALKIIEDVNKIYKRNKNDYLKYTYPNTIINPTYKNMNNYSKIIENNNSINLESLSSYWNKILNYDFKVFKYSDNNYSLFYSISNLLDSISNKKYNVANLKKLIVSFIKESPNKIKSKCFSKKLKNSYTNIININNDDNLENTILSDDYHGTVIDIAIFSSIFNLNFIILDKNIQKENPKGFRCIGPNMIKSNKYVLLYYEKDNDKDVFNLIENNNKVLFTKIDFTDNFKKFVIKFCKKC